MKMSMTTSALTKALSRVQGIVQKNGSSPNLAHVAFQSTAENKVIVRATDLEVGISGNYDAQIEQPGACAVHAKQLYGIVKSIPAAMIHLEAKENHWVEISSDSMRFRLVGISHDDYPQLPIHTTHDTFTVPASVLSELIDRALFCVSTDDSRPHLTGVFCESPEPKLLRMVSTDGHRLAMAEKYFDEDIALPEGVIVPRKVFQELKKLLAEGAQNDEDISLSFSKHGGVIRVGPITLSTRLLEGEFPNYSRVVPRDNKKIVIVPRLQLAESLRRVSLLSQGSSYAVRIILESGELALVAEDPEHGDAHETLSVDYDDSSLNLGFNARYLLDVLMHMQSENVEIKLADELSPALITAKQDEGFCAVVMPIRL